MRLVHIVQALNQNKVFRFVSSIKLAVPLMLALMICVAYGTIIESNYNAEYAKISIYNTNWFFSFLGLLWLNIFCSTVSRYPYQQRHTGFVITHIGLLTLLIGAMITGFWGIDGQLRVVEGQANNQISLSRMMLSYQIEGTPSPQSLSFDKSLNEKSESELSSLNDAFGHLFVVKRLVPFAKLEKNFLKTNVESNEVGLSFLLRSQFFQVGEWLHSRENPEMKMGPATLRLVVDNGDFKPDHPAAGPRPKKTVAVNKSKTPPKTSKSHSGVLLIKDAASKKVLKEINIAALKGAVTIGEVKVSLVKAFRRAVVAANKITEASDDGPANPALELSLESKGQKKREVCYGKFKDFSMNKDGDFGLAFEFQPGGMDLAEPSSAQAASEVSADSAMESPSPSDMPSAATGSRDGNVVEFHVSKKNPELVHLQLYKNGQFVVGHTMKAGESFDTPWMGMRVSLGTFAWGSEPVTVAEPIQPTKGAMLPPSAILIRPVGSDVDLWISEGEVKSFQSRGRNISVYFGQETADLPFNLKLIKFTKQDYPGTSTPMSYESAVEIQETGHQQVISMNEPLKHLGYTAYQASFVMNPGAPAESIFSVNRDPGRALKYLGSLILGIGIIVFTLMRSRFWRDYIQKKKG
jgi:hypothetical protein